MQTPNSKALESAAAHWAEAFGLAQVLLGDRAAAEDICQEALLRLALMERRIDDPERVRPLLLRIVRNLSVSERRRTRSDSLEVHTLESGPLVDLAAPDPLGEASRAEAVGTLRAALDGLSPAWRSVLYLRDGLGLSYAEIADIVEKSVDVVRVTLHRARMRVRAQLNGKLDEGSST